MKLFKKIYYKYKYKKSSWKIAITKVDDVLNIDTNVDYTVDKSISEEFNFVADPFLINYKNEIYLFFEIKLDKGVIGAIKIENNKLNFLGIVLKEDFHLSYPKVYKIGNEFFMIPESNSINEVRVYKAINFPYEWKYYKTLIKGKKFTDPTIVRYNDYYYMFVMQNWNLEIYYSKNFLGLYKPHLKNPFYTNNKKFSRPGGDFIIKKNILYRPVQDCHRFYGEKVYLMKVEKLTPTEFKEKKYKLFLKPSNKKWNFRKVHHFSYVKLNDKYLIAFDGEGYE